ncbi:MAG: hypothetical protein NT045_06820 [Candidatus Aureabacteria bacterium]|nr:hypothetical protein [Candidatus Auribacterota bacterium]
MVVARELTKVHEEFIRGTAEEILQHIGDAAVRGEVVLMIAGAGESVDWSRVDLAAYVTTLEQKLGIERKTAIKLAAQLSGIAKNIVYKETLGVTADRR